MSELTGDRVWGATDRDDDDDDGEGDSIKLCLMNPVNIHARPIGDKTGGGGGDASDLCATFANRKLFCGRPNIGEQRSNQIIFK